MHKSKEDGREVNEMSYLMIQCFSQVCPTVVILSWEEAVVRCNALSPLGIVEIVAPPVEVPVQRGGIFIPFMEMPPPEPWPRVASLYSV
jgi:hypothetical protein